MVGRRKKALARGIESEGGGWDGKVSESGKTSQPESHGSQGALQIELEKEEGSRIQRQQVTHDATKIQTNILHISLTMTMHLF